MGTLTIMNVCNREGRGNTFFLSHYLKCNSKLLFSYATTQCFICNPWLLPYKMNFLNYKAIVKNILYFYTVFLSECPKICAFPDFLPTELLQKSLLSRLFLLLLPQSQGALSSTLLFSATSSLLLSSLLKSCCFNYHLCADESRISRPFCSHLQFRTSFWIFATSPNTVCRKAEITFLPKASLLLASYPISVNNSTTLCPTSSQPGCHFQLCFPHKSCRFSSHCCSEIFAFFPTYATIIQSLQFLTTGSMAYSLYYYSLPLHTEARAHLYLQQPTPSSPLRSMHKN